MPRTTASAEPAQPEIAEPSIGGTLLVWSWDCTTPEQATVTRVHPLSEDGVWRVNVRTTADGPMSQDRWITSLQLVASEDEAGKHPAISAWWPPRVG